MGRFRQQVRDARRTLHDYMSVPALYFAKNGPVREITVRVHDKFMALGDLKGTNFHYAEMEDDSPRLVFMLSEVEPSRGYYVSVEPGVAYFIDTPRVPDDITQTCRCQRLSDQEAEGLPVPGNIYAYGNLELPALGGG